MGRVNPWHATFDALCDVMCEHWEDSITQQCAHHRDETLYDSIYFAEIRGRGVQVDLSENATASDRNLLDTGGAAEFLRVSIHDPFPTMLDLAPVPGARGNGKPAESFEKRLRIETFDPVADALVESHSFRALVERLEPFAVLRIEPYGIFCGRRIRDLGDLELPSVASLVEVMVDLADLAATPPEKGNLLGAGVY